MELNCAFVFALAVRRLQFNSNYFWLKINEFTGVAAHWQQIAPSTLTRTVSKAERSRYKVRTLKWLCACLFIHWLFATTTTTTTVIGRQWQVGKFIYLESFYSGCSRWHTDTHTLSHTVQTCCAAGYGYNVSPCPFFLSNTHTRDTQRHTDSRINRSSSRVAQGTDSAPVWGGRKITLHFVRIINCNRLMRQTDLHTHTLLHLHWDNGIMFIFFSFFRSSQFTIYLFFRCRCRWAIRFPLKSSWNLCTRSSEFHAFSQTLACNGMSLFYKVCTFKRFGAITSYFQSCWLHSGTLFSLMHVSCLLFVFVCVGVRSVL